MDAHESRYEMNPSRLRNIATHYAVQSGLSRQDAEDCASEFILHCIEALEWQDKLQPGNVAGSQRLISPVARRYPEAWWRRCAKNYVLNYGRGLRRYQSRLNPWCESTDHPHHEHSEYATADAPLLSCLQQEAHEEIQMGLCQLPDRTRTLIVGHHLEGKPLDLLAHQQGLQQNAVSQTLFRARAKLRHYLLQRGWTQHEFVEALSHNH